MNDKIYVFHPHLFSSIKGSLLAYPGGSKLQKVRDLPKEIFSLWHCAY